MSDQSGNQSGSGGLRMSGAGAIKRQHLRVSVNQEFDVIEDYIAEYVSNISQGGVFIRSKNPLALGTRVMLRFSVILDDVEIIEGEGEVVRVDRTPGQMGMGVAFTRLTAESKRVVDELIQRGIDAGVVLGEQ
jgi:uncharacterized protein (TIGR02266 family)